MNATDRELLHQIGVLKKEIKRIQKNNSRLKEETERVTRNEEQLCDEFYTFVDSAVDRMQRIICRIKKI